MQVTIDIPDEIAGWLDQPLGNISRRLVEIVVAEAYRFGEISTSQVQGILGLSSRLETHAFLKRMGVYLNYDAVELERDLQTIKEMRAK